MFEVKEASKYNINKGKEMAYEIVWSDGKEEIKVRAVKTADGWIRKEGFVKGKWVSGKPYLVKKNKKRQGERMIDRVEAFLKAA